MSGTEDKAISVQPFRLRRIVRKRMPEEHRPDFSAAQRQAKMPAGARMHRIHGESTGFIGGTE